MSGFGLDIGERRIPLEDNQNIYSNPHHPFEHPSTLWLCETFQEQKDQLRVQLMHDKLEALHV